jgi:rhodanese-related sulfurtransferase
VKSFYHFCGIGVLTLVAAFSTWFIKGTLVRELICKVSEISPEEVCLNTVLEDWKNDVIWVDARRKEDWEQDGIKGSVHITNIASENFDQLMEDAFPQLAQGKRVVVYCDDVGCGTSLEVAKRIREFQLVPDVKALYGGWKALKKAKLINEP